MTEPRTILFAGGGSGGHIFPNLAVLERLQRLASELEPHFVVSQRPLDARIVGDLGLAYTALPAMPLGARPDRLARFAWRYRQSEAMARRVIRQTRAAVVVATGGFVSGPAVTAAARAGVPVALVNLDAVPGRANRWAAARATAVFTTYAKTAGPPLPDARPIDLPLRESITTSIDPADARTQLGLAPDRPTLLVTAGSQGARSVNLALIELTTRGGFLDALAGWQVIHLAGARDVDAVREAYDKAGVAAWVRGFCDTMGPVWSAADLAISRGGAGSVAEVLVSATPCVFLPYPFHKDQHQRLNVAPLVDAGADAEGGALLLTDQVDPIVNADALADALPPLLTDADRRRRMREALCGIAPSDGALTLARWVVEAVA